MNRIVYPPTSRRVVAVVMVWAFVVVQTFAQATATSQVSSVEREITAPDSNRRTDAYGRDLDGRMRLLVEIVEEIRARCGDAYPLGVRVTGDDYVDGGLTLDDTRAIVQRLQERAPVEYVSLTTGMRSY